MPSPKQSRANRVRILVRCAAKGAGVAFLLEGPGEVPLNSTPFAGGND